MKSTTTNKGVSPQHVLLEGHDSFYGWKRLSEAPDITKLTEIMKRLKELRDQNPTITKEDLARSLGAEFNRTVTADNIDAGIEWLQDHNLVPDIGTDMAKTPLASGSDTAEPKIDGKLPEETKPADTPAASVPPPSSVQVASQPVTPPTSGKEQTEMKPAASVPDTTPPAEQTITLKVPAGLKRTPIGEIDLWIRRGYLARRDLEDLMKTNNNGRAYRSEINQCLALFEARSPPFNDIPVGVVPVVDGTDTANIRHSVGGTDTAQIPEIPVIPASAPPSSSIQPAISLPSSSGVPAEFVAARSLTDVEVINSLRSEYGTRQG
jgi:hypothetical protein